MKLIKLNNGGFFETNAQGGQPFDVTIEEETFSTPFDISPSQTATNFVAQHSQNIADRYGILAVSFSNTVEFYNLQGAQIISNGSGNQFYITSELSINLSTLQSISPLNESALDVSLPGKTLTIATASAKDARSIERELERTLSTGGTPVAIQTAHKAVLAPN